MTTMQDKVLEWLLSSDTGMSSRTIALAGIGGKRPEPWGWDVPHDPADFGRCARLLARIPELRTPAFLRLLQEGGEKWPKLIARWDEVQICMSQEVGIDWSKGQSAPKTYKLMKGIVA